MTAIANAGGGTTISATTQLSLAGVTASGDIQGRDIVATRELHADGAMVLNGTLAVGGAATLSGTLTVGGSNVMTAIAAKQNALTTTTALSVASVTTTSASTLNGVRVSGGQGQAGTGANLRVVGTGILCIILVASSGEGTRSICTSLNCRG